MISKQSKNFEINKRPDYRKWTKEEEEILTKLFGVYSYSVIAKKLNRTEIGIVSKARKLKLGNPIGATEYITLCELAECLGRSKSTIKRWIANKELPATKKVISQKEKIYRINIDKFWKWAYGNLNLMKWELYTRNSLGKEPKWLEQKIKEYNSKNKDKNDKWNDLEKANLKLWYTQGLSIAEIAKRLKRSERAVDIRLTLCGIKRTRLISIPWKEEEIKMLIDMRNRKLTSKQIAEELGRTDRSVRRKLERLKEELNRITA